MVDESIELLLDDARDQMDKSIEHLRSELNSIRAGRATPAMLQGVRVDYYGSQTPLQQLASVAAPQPDLLVVQPYDRSALQAIEKGIMTANMGLNPSNDGSIVRVPVPPLSEERRRDLVKTARTRGEEAKIAIRNIRRHVKDEIKKVQEEENLSEDMLYEGEERLQTITDDYIARVDKLLEKKEGEVMTV